MCARVFAPLRFPFFVPLFTFGRQLSLYAAWTLFCLLCILCYRWLLVMTAICYRFSGVFFWLLIDFTRFFFFLSALEKNKEKTEATQTSPVARTKAIMGGMRHGSSICGASDVKRMKQRKRSENPFKRRASRETWKIKYARWNYIIILYMDRWTHRLRVCAPFTFYWSEYDPPSPTNIYRSINIFL